MCDRPLKGFKIGYTRKGKPDYLVCSSDVKYVWKDKNDVWHKSFDYSSNGGYNSTDFVKEYTPIPCGSCLSCRITRAAEMADRCMLELKYHNEACFVTLTYNDDNLIVTNYTRVDTGETGWSATLFKKHYQDFFKRLRKAYPDKDIRYVLCGEYGETTERPHYHAIIFGYRPNDLVPYSYNKRGQVLYLSESLSRIWSHGFAVVGECTRDSCNYVSRYVTKKLYNDLGEDQYKYKARIAPFVVSSKRPAIGKRWYDDNKDWCFDHQISYATADGGHSFKAPRYFKKLRELDAEMKYYVEDDLNVDVKYKQEVISRDYNNQLPSIIGDAKDRKRKSKNLGFKRDSI